MRQHESQGRKRARSLLARTGYHMGKLGGHMAEGSGSDYEKDKRMVESAIRQHEKHDHTGEPLTRLRLADGGSTDGEEGPRRADRGGRGKGGGAKGKPHTRINIMVGGGDQQPRPVPVPVPVPAGGGGMPPPRPPMPPPGGMGGPPGGMPGGMPGGPMGGPPMGMMGAPPPRPPLAGAMGVAPPPGAPMMRKAGGRTRLQAGGMGAPSPVPVSAPPAGAGTPSLPYLMGSNSGMPAGLVGSTPGQTAKRGGRLMGPGRVEDMEAGSGSGEGRLEKSRSIAKEYCGGGAAK